MVDIVGAGGITDMMDLMGAGGITDMMDLVGAGGPEWVLPYLGMVGRFRFVSFTFSSRDTKT